jgi:virginiamycin B lyase
LTLSACLAGLAISGAALATFGTLRELKIPPPGSRPNAIANGPDRAVWFTELSPPAIGRHGSSGFSNFPLPNPAVPYSIVAGPDGALWFTESSGAGIGRITTSGQITEFDVPPCSGCGYPSGPLGLTVGSDGALWYTRPGNDTIGRVTTSGQITEIPVPAPLQDATWIVNGPDGALWFTDDTGLGRMTTDGSASQVWPGLNYPSSIALGPDGNLWLTGSSQDVVARVTPTGRGKLFGLDLNCDPQWIAPGAGALWIPCYQLDEIEHVSTSGVVTRISVPSHLRNYPDVLSGIVKGPGDAMWFTEYAADRLGRISTK